METAGYRIGASFATRALWQTRSLYMSPKTARDRRPEIPGAPLLRSSPFHTVAINQPCIPRVAVKLIKSLAS